LSAVVSSWLAVSHERVGRPTSYEAKRLFKRLLRKHKGEPRKIVTDKLRSYNVAHRKLIPEAIHDTTQYANN
jgi:transposase-like protein